MPRPVADQKMARIQLWDVVADPDNSRRRYATGHCPRCDRTSRFSQNRFPMNYWQMEDQVWSCSGCEWNWPGDIVDRPLDADVEPEIPLFRDPDLN
jgi:hypothetical protein